MSKELIEAKLHCQLKEHQWEAIQACSSSDCVCILPTGYGKTKVMEALPYLREDTCVLVASPLICILDQQKELFGQKAHYIRAEELPKLVDPESEVSEILKKKEFILGRPEDLTSTEFKKFLMEQMSRRVSHLVVDEAHVVISWGTQNFRPAFKELSTLRAILPEMKILAMTATATEKSRGMLEQLLKLNSPKRVLLSPDRPNISLHVTWRKSSVAGAEESVDEVVDPILRQLKKSEENFERTIIYVGLKWCGYIHSRAINHFKIPADKFIAQYHSPQTKEMKDKIQHGLQHPQGHLRLLLATEAYGMGADCPNIRNVLHIGPPNTIETYMQEIGRSGRDSQSSTATIFYNNSDLGNNIHLTSEMKEYILATTCRREVLLCHFGFQKGIKQADVICCDNCENMNVDSQLSDNLHKTANISHAKETKCKNLEVYRRALGQYFSAVNASKSAVCVPEMLTGLSGNLLSKIISKVGAIDSITDLLQIVPELNDTYAKNIMSIISRIRAEKSS